jgi:serine/threonine protein kinase
VEKCFVEFGTRFFAMQLWVGQDLASFINQHGPADEATCKATLGKITSALTYAHKRGILHCDIKPANILVDGSGRVAVTDFGLCKLIGDTDGSTVVVGTPPYMPPEQFQSGARLGPAADWYSLGCTAYEMFVGQRLFKSASIKRLLQAKLKLNPQFFLRDLPLSGDFREVLTGWLQPLAADRKSSGHITCGWATPESSSN